MPRRYAELMFTANIRAPQEEGGSRDAFAKLEKPGAPGRDALREEEREFIASRNSFYLAAVTATGWPYIQHHGGPAGFLKVLDALTLGFADYGGNMQFVSIGNLAENDRVALFMIDYPRRLRLKVIGRARIVPPESDPATMRLLQDDYEAAVERGIVISVEGYDWNCNQHITPRFTEEELAEQLNPILSKLKKQEEEIARLRTELERAEPAE